MNSIIFCLILILKVIICDKLKGEAKESKYGGPWPPKPQMPYPAAEVPYPAPEMTYPPSHLEPAIYKPSTVDNFYNFYNPILDSRF